MKTVTTRRVIRPAGGPDPVAPAPMRATPPPLPALVPKRTLWSSWTDRFAKVEQFSSSLAQEVERIRAKPRQPDLAEARRLQDLYLTPWTELQDTFEAAAGAEVGEALRNDYRSYLDLRASLIRALVRRCLAPGDAAVAQLDAAMLALQNFVDARRSRA